MNIYQIKITLRHVAPPVWRRIDVPGDIRLDKLHVVLQAVMGWTNTHLHAFRIGNGTYGIPDPDFPDDTKNERNVRLDSVAHEGDSIIYEYDFGDGWEHDLKIEKVLAPEDGASYPRCIDGKRACPPEDCGGPPGYANLLEAIKDPGHEEHEAMLEWLGEDFDPEAFDLNETNRLLRHSR